MNYIAFLRGINVSGQKIIKMAELAKMFSDMKFKNVKTFIQSGNVLFESNEKDTVKLETKIEKQIDKVFGFDVMVFVRAKEELEKIVQKNPFAKIKIENPKFSILFVKDKDAGKIKVPVSSDKFAVEIIGAQGSNYFCSANPDVVGSSGGANLFIEKEYKIKGTARNWKTVMKILSLE
ncbi:MAG: DUF1697 domain-containing protein [Bacteroidetes bacterium]|nr:DUF1697 domain-containing protein [Bacteroidota bacterium]